MYGGLFRYKLSDYLDRLGGIVGKTRIPPNLFSFLALPIAGVAAYFFATHRYTWALGFMLLAFAWDALDGGVARSQGKATQWGSYLDPLIDKYVEIVVQVGLALAGYSIEALLVITGSLVLSYAKARAAIAVPIDNHDWPAVGERVDRVMLLTIAVVAAIVFPTVGIAGKKYSLMSILLYLTAVVVYIGGVQRMFYANMLIKAGGTQHVKVKYRR